MATITKRGEYQWQAKVRCKGFPPVSKTFNTKKDAELWSSTTESEMGRGVYTDRSSAESITLFEALELYEKDISQFKDGANEEKYRIGLWKRDPLAQRSLASLKTSDFAKWRDMRLETVSATTIKKDLSVISNLFNVAPDEWNISVLNPIKNVRIKTEDNSRDRRIEADEEPRLMEALGDMSAGNRSNIWILPMVKIAIETAARQSELLALKWVDVKPNEFTMRIFGKERADGKTRTKNGTKFRDVPLSPTAIKIFETMPRETEYVFPTTASAIKQSWVRARKRANITDMVFHDTRHEATSRLAEIFQIHELAKITGHKDIRTLLKYYHPRAEDLAKKMR